MVVAPWRAACVQMKSAVASDAPDKAAAWAIIDANVDHALQLVHDPCAGPDKPRLVVLPEFAFQGPPRATPVSQWIERACTTIPGPITGRLAEAARRHGIYIAGNHFEVDPLWPDRYFNASFLLDPDGEVILRYRRINTASWTSPHDILDQYREAYGEDGLFPVVDTELGRLAIFPCGEINVPELSRVFMMRGAEVLLHPDNGAVSLRTDAAKISRAAENMCYLVSSNVAGSIGFGGTDGGSSAIIDHLGHRIAHEESAAETTITAMIDIEALRAARRDTGMGNMLLRSRWEMYRDYFATAEFYPANGLDGRTYQTFADLKSLGDQAVDNLTRAGVIR